MKFLKKTLSNGITVIAEQRELPVVSLGIANRFGASSEKSDIKGVAHFIEHLLFTGTLTRTHEQISSEIEKKGGILNAFTANDVTCYYFKLPSEHIFSGLDILSDILKNPAFNREKFEKEKKVILEEIKMYHDMPQRHIYDKIAECLYEKPFGEGIIGSENTIKPLTRDFVADYFNQHYSPENYIITIVGKFDFEEVCSYLEQNFKRENKSLPKVKLSLKHSNFKEERPGLDQAHFMFAIHAPLADTSEHYILQVLDAYLGNGMSSQLFLKIREEKGLAYAVTSSINTEKNYSYYSIYVGTTKEALAEVESLILQCFKDVEKMTEQNLKEAKERLVGLRKVSSEESSEVLSGLLFAELAGDASHYYEYEKNIQKVTLAQVKALAKINNYSTATIAPK